MESLHIGTPPAKFDEWETKTTYVHNFMDLSHDKRGDNFVESPSFCCFGHEWKLRVYPGGLERSSSGWVIVGLANSSSTEISLDWKPVS
jgi:hypothetical protein